jgi:hypothetical protein
MRGQEQKRQKKLAKKRSKEIRKKRELAQQKQRMASLAGQMQLAAQGSIHECLISQSAFDSTGMATVMLARQMSGGRIGVAVFCVDLFCLGVKDAFGRVCSLQEYREIVDKFGEADVLEPAPPSHARCLVEAATRYAERLGFAPHPDYRKVAPIWGDIDANQCDVEFEFGRNGKPCYVCGPRDDLSRQRLIMQQLAAAVGPDNFDVIVRPESAPQFELEEYADDDDEDDDDDSDDSEW